MIQGSAWPLRENYWTSLWDLRGIFSVFYGPYLGSLWLWPSEFSGVHSTILRESQENFAMMAKTCYVGLGEPVIICVCVCACVWETETVCVCVCVCVCVWERERERERENSYFKNMHIARTVEKYELSSCFLCSRSLPVRKSIVIQHEILQHCQEIMLWNAVQRSQRRMQLPELKAQRQPTLIIKLALRRFNTSFELAMDLQHFENVHLHRACMHTLFSGKGKYSCQLTDCRLLAQFYCASPERNFLSSSLIKTVCHDDVLGENFVCKSNSTHHLHTDVHNREHWYSDSAR